MEEIEVLGKESQEKQKNKKTKTGMSESDFFGLTDLAARKAQIFVTIPGRKRFDEQTGKVVNLSEDKEIKVAPSYWLNIQRTYDKEQKFI